MCCHPQSVLLLGINQLNEPREYCYQRTMIRIQRPLCTVIHKVDDTVMTHTHCNRHCLAISLVCFFSARSVAQVNLISTLRIAGRPLQALLHSTMSSVSCLATKPVFTNQWFHVESFSLHVSLLEKLSGYKIYNLRQKQAGHLLAHG